MIILFLIQLVSAITYNVNLQCYGVDYTIYLKWNISEIRRIEHDMINNPKLQCETHYDSCSYAQLNLFGFLPNNLGSISRLKETCEEKNTELELCQSFVDQVNTVLNVKYFVLPEYLIIETDLINFLTKEYGDVCINIITNNLNSANNNKTLIDFWNNLYVTSDVICYDHFFLSGIYKNYPIMICNDYHKDTSLRQNVLFQCPNDICCVTYQQYVIGRANISKCDIIEENKGTNTKQIQYIMMILNFLVLHLIINFS